MAIMALYSAATGMRALSQQLDVISNNIANANNNGFKSSRVNFEDLLYQQQQQPGTQNTNGDIRPIGIEIGLGTRVTGTQLDFTQGSAVQTTSPYDVMVNGNGFFQVKVLQGQGNGLAYTRTGSFTLDSNGNMVMANSSGYKLDPPIQIPTNATAVTISNDGRVFATVPGNVQPQMVGQMQLTNFANPEGLTQIGGNLYQQTEASGAPITGTPGTQGFGTLQQNYLEASNVDPVKELVDLIKTQRVFEMNSQSIQASDQMLQVVAHLRQ